ncbi:nuclear transport factor 2 family protein [Massilia sp. CCM 8734]|uniref:nuclear transport factor 2 family protein n=1 Tax=Massilia sp. CCM 8734 TaxID=2609283 RepID=UPI0014247FFB|nr:nuclear transport factor 2 family protein [Massilia sp. CCM 8734]NIA00235.1 peptidase [Massilia sp. CCM 8734]
MRQHFFLRALLGACLLFCLSGRATAIAAPGDTEQIRETLTDYMEGTANGEPERLRRAFHPDFNLYAVTEAGTLLVRSGGKYIADIKPGNKVNRIGRILSIDVENNAASAKVEIAMPNFRIYTDYFMLLKYEGGWKIVHKSYTWKEAPKSKDKVLFITSNQHTYGNTKLNASNHFEEIVIAYDIFRKSGLVVDFVSPNGGAIPVGYVDTSNQTQKDYLYDAGFMNLLKNTFKPAQVDPNDYKAIYYSGGGAAMFGVAENADIQRIALKIHDNGGVISAVCHGTAGIVNLKNSAGASIFSNRKITGFPDIFENTAADYYKTFPFSIGKEIARQGGNFVHSKRFGDNFHVVDGNFITGQDPSSTASVARKVIETIQKMH